MWQKAEPAREMRQKGSSRRSKPGRSLTLTLKMRENGKKSNNTGDLLALIMTTFRQPTGNPEAQCYSDDMALNSANNLDEQRNRFYPRTSRKEHVDFGLVIPRADNPEEPDEFLEKKNCGIVNMCYFKFVVICYDSHRKSKRLLWCFM